MEKWIKDINKLNSKNKNIIWNIIEKIISFNWDTLDIKKMNWFQNIYRCRYWKYRILFSVKWKEIFIEWFWPRWWMYK